LVLSSAVSFADNSRARALFEQGEIQFHLLHFDQALKLFERAYEENSDPVFLYNIAQCQRQLAQYELASKSYRAYLATAPDAANRADVVALIAQMEEAAQRNRATVASDGRIRPPEISRKPALDSMPHERLTPQRRWRTVTGAVLISVGGAALVGGLASGLVARSESDAVTADALHAAEFVPSKESAGTAAQTASIALYAIGGAAAVSGIVLMVLDWNHRRHHRTELGWRQAAAGATP
jgi:tetratricopeptide (TPR) repeat protein